MIRVRYSNEEQDFIHNIDIKKVERLEDGTFLVRGKERGFSQLLHLTVDGFGKFSRIPHTSKDYIKLMLPFVKKSDVTDSLKGQLDGMNIDTLPKIEKSNTVIKMFFHPILKKMYISRGTAYELGYVELDDSVKDTKNNIINPDTDLTKDYYEISDLQFEKIKEKYKIEVTKFEIREYKDNVSHKDDVNEVMESRISKLLIDLKYYIEQKGNIDESTRSLITQLIAREKKITNYPNGEYKEELLNILYCDMVDILSTARGLNLSHERVGNYNKKVDSYMKLLSMKEKDMDLSNVKEILNDIEDNINEAYKLTNAVDPRTWFLIETFTNGLTNVLLIEDPNLFRRQISLYNKDNLLYNQIIFQLTNYIEGKTNTK